MEEVVEEAAHGVRVRPARGPSLAGPRGSIPERGAPSSPSSKGHSQENAPVAAGFQTRDFRDSPQNPRGTRGDPLGEPGHDRDTPAPVTTPQLWGHPRPRRVTPGDPKSPSPIPSAATSTSPASLPAVPPQCHHTGTAISVPQGCRGAELFQPRSGAPPELPCGILGSARFPRETRLQLSSAQPPRMWECREGCGCAGRDVGVPRTLCLLSQLSLEPSKPPRKELEQSPHSRVSPERGSLGTMPVPHPWGRSGATQGCSAPCPGLGERQEGAQPGLARLTRPFPCSIAL